jgi:hypothetical protein
MGKTEEERDEIFVVLGNDFLEKKLKHVCIIRRRKSTLYAVRMMMERANVLMIDEPKSLGFRVYYRFNSLKNLKVL